MPGRLATSVANAVLDFLFGAGANALAPADYVIALSSSKPTVTGGNVTEPVGNGYKRVTVPNNAANWPAAANRVKRNGADIVFPAATGSWGSPGFVAVYDPLGVFKAWGPLASAQEIPAGMVPTFGPGAFTLAHPGT